MNSPNLRKVSFASSLILFFGYAISAAATDDKHPFGLDDYPGSPDFPRLAEQRRDVFTEIKDC